MAFPVRWLEKLGMPVQEGQHRVRDSGLFKLRVGAVVTQRRGPSPEGLQEFPGNIGGGGEESPRILYQPFIPQMTGP